MTMFSLDKTKAKVAAVTPRMEHHGDELVPAVSIKLTVPTTNDVLSEFDPWLKGALYRRPDSGQGELIEDASHMPIAKFPKMGAFDWDYRGIGYCAAIHQEFIDDIVIEDVSIDGIRIEAMDGGHVLLHLRLGAKPNASTIGALCQLLQHDIEITLTEPQLDEEEQKDAA
jgi:mycofactocin precursor